MQKSSVSHRVKRRRLNGIRVFGLLTLVGAGYLLALLARIYFAGQQDDLRGVSPEHARADVIIVLGTRQNNGQPSAVLTGRLEHAIALYQAGYAPFLLFTGGKQPGDLHTEAGTGRRYAMEHGVPAEAILLEPRGRTTMQSLQACSVIMRDRGLKRAVVVSDPFHAFRLRRMMHDLGIAALVSPTPTSRIRSFSKQIRYVVYEMPKYTLYRLFGV